MIGSNESTKRGRGRPRREGADEEILVVARELLRDKGYRDFTVDAIAERTRIAKTTIYRRFASKGELIAAAIAPANGVAEAQDVETIVRDTANVLRLLAAPQGEAIDIIRAIVQPRHARIRELLAEHPNRNTTHDATLAADLLMGALLTRLLVSPDLGDADELVRAVL